MKPERSRIETRISQGEFILNMAKSLRHDSVLNQARFSEHLEELSVRFGIFLRRNGLINKLDYNPQSFWPSQKGRSLGFVDGGLAKSDLPGAGALGIRAASYVVKPGLDGPDREDFQIEFAITDDIYSDEAATFTDESLDHDKLRSAARILAEACSLLALTSRRDDLNLALLHGPLINPVGPYALPSLPPFQESLVSKLIGGDRPKGNHFIYVYKHVLDKLLDGDVSVAGVVERDGGGTQVIRSILEDFTTRGDLPSDDAEAANQLLDKYGLSDTQVFDIVLNEGEYLTPRTIIRRGTRESQWYETYRDDIREYPDLSVSFIKPSPLTKPFRVETFEGKNLTPAIEMSLFMARLLPRYGFPVGLQVADSMAKIPAWLSKNISSAHKAALLKKAMTSGSPRLREYALKMISANHRDWLFRPGQ